MTKIGLTITYLHVLYIEELQPDKNLKKWCTRRFFLFFYMVCTHIILLRIIHLWIKAVIFPKCYDLPPRTARRTLGISLRRRNLMWQNAYKTMGKGISGKRLRGCWHDISYAHTGTQIRRYTTEITFAAGVYVVSSAGFSVGDLLFLLRRICLPLNLAGYSDSFQAFVAPRAKKRHFFLRDSIMFCYSPNIFCISSDTIRYSVIYVRIFIKTDQNGDLSIKYACNT